MSPLVDPSDILRARYEEEVDEVKARFGEPSGFRDRRRLRRELRRLERKYFEQLPRISAW